MILQQVSDHQDASVLACELRQFLGMLDVQGQGLFDEDVLAAFERAFREGIVLHRRRGNHHALDILPLENLFVGSADVHSLILLLQLFQAGAIYVTDDA